MLGDTQLNANDNFSFCYQNSPGVHGFLIHHLFSPVSLRNNEAGCLAVSPSFVPSNKLSFLKQGVSGVSYSPFFPPALNMLSLNKHNTKSKGLNTIIL